MFSQPGYTPGGGPPMPTSSPFLIDSRARTGPVRVYLDQNKWIGLCRANVGAATATAPEAAALGFLRTAVRRGEVICPMGVVHVWEANKAPRADQRAALADLMLELSRGRVLWPWHAALICEAEYAVRAFVGDTLPAPPWQQAVDVGTEHLLGMPLKATAANGDHVQVPTSAREFSRSPDALRLAIETLSPEVGSAVRAEQQATAEIEQVRLAAHSARVGKDRLRHDNLRQLYDYWLNAIAMAAEKVGREPLPGPVARPLPASIEFFQSLPLCDAMVTFTTWRDGEWSRRLDRNDLRDARWSDVAYAYCDVVVAEKYIVTCARNSKLAERLRVGSTRRLADLESLVAEARRP